MLKLYTRETSGHSYKVRLALWLLNVEHEFVQVPIAAGKNQVDEAFRAKNPRAQIPMIEDNGTVVWGSTGCLVYVASTRDPAGNWLPRDPHGLTSVAQWLEFTQTEIAGLATARVIKHLGFPGDLAAAQELGQRALAILETHLAGKSWLVGARPTIADIACFPYVALAPLGGVSLDGHVAVIGWIDRFKALPGFKPMPGLS